MAIISYSDFKHKLDTYITSGDTMYYNLLEKVVDSPGRYIGYFRASNTQTKLIQNATQSREIKFGDFIEDIVTDYIAKLGYKNLPKNLGKDHTGKLLMADQLFEQSPTSPLYLIEQKIRDDHDSSKKEGQYNNFQKKYQRLAANHPGREIVAVMWSIDPLFTKNHSYYNARATAEKLPSVSIHILYGEELFTTIFRRPNVWAELCAHLEQNKAERGEGILTIPDFDTSPEILAALIKLKQTHPQKFAKLATSTSPAYHQLRAELFPTGHNLRQAARH